MTDTLGPYRLGAVHCADCVEAMRALPDGCVDAVITDPPYGTEDLGGGYGRRQLHTPDGRHGRRIANDSDLSVIAGICAELPRLLMPGWFAIFCAPRRRQEVDALLTVAGLSALGEFVWDKARPGLGYTIRYSHETAVIGKAGEPFKGAVLLSVYRYPAHGTPEHPHEKPAEVMRRLVGFATRPGSLILDPCAGSGTTGVACKQLGRRFLGFEIDPHWCEVANQRIAAAAAGVSLAEHRAGQGGLFGEGSE